ncbi:MAG: sugar transferase [Hyphomicrobiaceae bacterium]
MRVVVFGPAEEIIRRANETAKQPRPPKPKTTTSNDPGPVGGSMKRCVDILIAVTLIMLLWPLMTIVTLLIKINMGGPVIFAHQRVGANGKAFKCYKFRTMISNAEQALLQHFADNPESKREWETTAKLRNDPRVTKLGRLLRRSSIDELPQLLNVLKGDMSCVGPRPVVAAELAPYGEHASDYLAARPGLSGIWQVSGRSNIGYGTRIKLDSLYVRRWSMALDMAILLATIPAVLRSKETS